jgi:hypothetical protein
MSVSRSRMAASTFLLTFGRPSRDPAALARARPAFTLAWIIERSNSAKTPVIPECGVGEAVGVCERLHRVWVRISCNFSIAASLWRASQEDFSHERRERPGSECRGAEGRAGR